MRHRPMPVRSRFAAVALAAVLACAGLWLAVGAGAQKQESTRAAGYPAPQKPYAMHIDSHPSKRTHSRRARFRFHVTFNPSGHVPPSQRKFLAYKCKLDSRHYKKCTSPKTYRHLHKGKHVFKVKAVFKNGGGAASDPARFRWKII
jgi:hypothetical protein